jgi:hypothetical protein
VGSPQAFLSYRTRLRDEVAPLVEALTLAGVRVWRDEARVDEGSSITSEVIDGLSSSHALLAYYSPDYPRSRICQWEQAAAWVAAEAAGPAQERVLLLLPHDVAGPEHVLGLLRDELALRVPAPSAREDLKRFAEEVARRLHALDGRSLGELLPLAVPPEWKLRARVAPSERFTGRAKDLWNLHALLHRDKLTVITGRTSPSTAQVRGLGGIGKTLLAVEYVARFGAGFPGGIFWIDTANRTPESARVDAAIALGVPADKPEQLRAALLGCGSYLWVADNLPSGLSQAEVEAWCAPTSNGRTLVTTRSKTWGAMGGTLDLGVLEPDEALELLTRRRPTTTEVAAAEELCRRVGYHPLTVDVLGALIGLHSSERPYAAWRAQLDHPSEDALRLGERLAEELPTGSARYAGTVLRASLEGLAPEALDLLLLSVSLAEAPIPAALAVAVCDAARGRGRGCRGAALDDWRGRGRVPQPARSEAGRGAAVRGASGGATGAAVRRRRRPGRGAARGGARGGAGAVRRGGRHQEPSADRTPRAARQDPRPSARDTGRAEDGRRGCALPPRPRRLPGGAPPLRARPRGQDAPSGRGAPRHAPHPAEPRRNPQSPGRSARRAPPLRARPRGHDAPSGRGAPPHAQHPAEPRRNPRRPGRSARRAPPLRARPRGQDAPSGRGAPRHAPHPCRTSP